MVKINPDHVAVVKRLINEAPYFKLLSMQVEELGPGVCDMVVEVGRQHFNPFGSVHGGLAASVIDTAAFWAVYCELEDNAGITTLDIDINYLAPMPVGTIRVKGKSIRIGRRICLGQAELYGENGKLLVHGVSKILVSPGQQVIDQVVRCIGGEAPPPKFLSD